MADRHHASEHLLGWLKPWRVEGVTAERLGAILVIAVLWDVVLSFDGNGSIGKGWFPLILTVTSYPALATVAALTLSQPMTQFITRLRPRRCLTVVRPLLVIVFLGLLAQAPSYLQAKAPVLNDVTPSAVCAARTVLRDHDPYVEPELLCLHQLHLSYYAATPLRAGVFTDLKVAPDPTQMTHLARQAAKNHYHSAAIAKFGYPPMAFVWMLPVALLGRAWWAAWTMLAALLFLFLAGLLSGRWWWATVCILCLQWGTGSVLSDATQGSVEFFACALIALSLMSISSPRRSAIALGLAIATNPLAWVITPAYLLFSARLPALRERLVWLAATGIVAIVPWLFIYHDAAGGIWRLLTQPEFAGGIGLAGFLLGIGLIAPSTLLSGAFLVAEIANLAAARYWRRMLPAAPLLAIALFWLDSRGLAGYLSQLPLLACATAIGLWRLERDTAAPHASPL
ncbi:MAG: hypothetical protein WBA31_00465 [Candidatus Dormiibacterota bacterium]